MTEDFDDQKNNAVIYGKLVRDRIPEIIRNHGKQPFTRQIEGSALTSAISEKILEEAFELYAELNKGNPEEILKESADLLEIILTALHTHGFTLDDLLARAETRKLKRGGFEDRLFLDQVGGGELCEIEFQKHPAFIFNPYTRGKLLHIIRTELAQSKSTWIASAFYSPGATNLLVSEFSKFIKTGGNLKILLSTMGNITRPEYLEHLAAQVPNESLKVFHPPDIPFHKVPPHFHVKTWLFEHTDGQGAMIIGSSNFTQGGLVNNIEWNYFSPREINVAYDNQTTPFQSAVAEYERMWQDTAVPVTREFIDGYKMRCPPPSDWVLRPETNKDVFDPKHTFDGDGVTVIPNTAQKEALENLAAQRSQGATKAAVVAATGIGKTYLAAFDYQQSRYKSFLFIAHREDILAGARESFRKVLGDPNFGVIYGRGNNDIGDGRAVFAMIQSLSRNRHLERFPQRDFEYIVIDEFHHAEASGYQRILSHFRPEFLLGLTATPERMDGRNVLAHCDYNVAYEIRILEAVNRGWLAPFQYFAIYDETDYEQIPWRGTHYDEKALDEALENDTRTAIIARNIKKYLPSAGKIKALAFCTSVSHARYTAEKLTKDHHIQAEALWGNTSDENRHNAMNRLQQEDDPLNVICTVDIFNEGTDIPSLTHVLFLRPTQSFTLFLQQLGRGLRKYPGKDFLVVLDFVGNFKKSHIAPLALSGYTSPAQVITNSNTNIQKTITNSLPEGCYLSADLEVQRIWDSEIKEIFQKALTPEDRLKMIYQEIKSDLDKDDPLDLMDMLQNAYDIDPFIFLKKFGSWLQAKKHCENGNLNNFETSLLGTPGEYLLRHIESGMNPVKSYKMVVLLSLLKLEGTAWPVKDIAKEFLAHYLNNTNHIADYAALAKSPVPEQYPLSSVVAHLKSMPLDKLSNADDDCFVLDKSKNIFHLKPEYEPYWQQESFRNLVKDRAQFLLARYFLRVRLQQTIYYHPSILTEGFTIKRHFADKLFGENPPDPEEKRQISIIAGQNRFKAHLHKPPRDKDYRVSYQENSRIAEFFQSTFEHPPETGEKAFTLIAEGNNLRLELPEKFVDLRGLLVDIPYARKPEDGLTARFRELLRKAPDQAEWEAIFEKPGYDGSMEIEVMEGDSFRAWTGTKFKDKSRFPARIKAAATALLHEGFRGEYHVEAKRKRFQIRKLQK